MCREDRRGVNLSLSIALWARMKELAKEDHRSLTNLVELVLMDFVKRNEDEKAA